MLGTNLEPQNWNLPRNSDHDYLDMIHEFKKTMPGDGKVLCDRCSSASARVNHLEFPRIMNYTSSGLCSIWILPHEADPTYSIYHPFMGKKPLLPDGVQPNTEGLGIMAASDWTRALEVC